MSTIIAQCECGARYKVDASAVGRRVKCKKCGQTFKVHDRPKGLAERSPSKSPAPLGSGQVVARIAGSPALSATPPPATAVASPPTVLAYANMSEGGPTVDRSSLGFARSLLGSFLFFRRIGNVGTFLLAWGLLVAGNVGGGLLLSVGNIWISSMGLLAFVLAEGSFAAFSFDTISQAADGEDELPAFPLAVGPEDWWDLLIKPFFAFVGTCVLVLIPAIVYSTMAGAAAFGGVSIGPADQMIGLGGLAALGLFLWPMLILCVAIGGFDALLRVGRIISAIIQTFIPYACTVLMVYLSAAAYIFISVYLDSGNLSGIVVTLLAFGVRVFLQTATMRAIGAYYYRHDERLAWMVD